MNIALIGPSGVGKGTQAAKLIERFDLLHLVTGELFRQNLEERRAVGLLAKGYMTRGQLVPDEVVNAMVEEWLWRADPDKGILFDGFPRTRYQAEFLESFLEELGRDLDVVIYMKISDQAVMRRLTGRLTCRKCQATFHTDLQPFDSCPYDRCEAGEYLYRREDDIPEIARVRLRAFHRVAASFLYYYQRMGKLIIVDGEQEVEAVYQDLVETIEAVQDDQVQFATWQDLEQVYATEAISVPRTPKEVFQPSLNLVLVGGPGSGKGTQAEQLRAEFDVPHISTGDLFRENLKQETELGKLAKSYMDRGDLVPDDVTEAMVEERLSRPDTKDGFILDGFPRTLPQAEALTQIMDNMERRLSGVLYIKVSDAEIVERLSGRLICGECQTPFHEKYNPFEECPYDKCNGEHLYRRDDDKPETIRARLRTFHAQTAPLINYYREADLLAEIDGEGAVDEVTERTTAAVKHMKEPVAP